MACRAVAISAVASIFTALLALNSARAESPAEQKILAAINLRRDPRASLCVFTERFYGSHVEVEGRAEIISLPEAMELLVAYYRNLAGEHPDWDEYRRAMIAEGRCLIRITIEKAVG